MSLLTGQVIRLEPGREIQPAYYKIVEKTTGLLRGKSHPVFAINNEISVNNVYILLNFTLLGAMFESHLLVPNVTARVFRAKL